MYIRLYIKYPLFLSDFGETGIFWQVFENTYNISWKSVQQGPCCSMRAARPREGQKDGQIRQTDMTKQMIAFRNFANTPNYF